MYQNCKMELKKAQDDPAKRKGVMKFGSEQNFQ